MIDQVPAQVPDENKHTKILVRIDGAGASHDTIAHLEALNHSRRRVAWTIGWTITEAEEAAIAQVPETAWSVYLDHDGELRTVPDPVPVLDDDAPAGVRIPDEIAYGYTVEITGLLRRENWPEGTRWIARRVPITDRDRSSGSSPPCGTAPAGSTP